MKRSPFLSLPCFCVAFATCLSFIAVCVAQESSDKATGDIFATIWDLPESHIVVSTMGADGNPVSPGAQVVLQEQGRAGDCLDQDNAPEPLLSGVDETVFEEPTFKTFIALLDNYTAVEGLHETDFSEVGNSRWKEVDAFLDAVFESKTMKVAIEHIQSELSPDLSTETIRSDVKTMWFEPYTNNYSSAQSNCVGFEHVFVGEDESTAGGSQNCKDAVAGYHSWVKFYLEQKQDKVNYLGYDYPEGNVEDALDDMKVATMLMRWSPTKEDDGAHGNDLLKKPGGFFIGTRPELEIAFGTLAMYAQKAGKYDNVPGKENHHRVKLGQNYYDLVMHPQSLEPAKRGQPAKRGDHIRTLYPKFRGRTIPEAVAARTSVDLPTQPHNDSQIRIVKALPNPEAENDVGEWVELKNVTEETNFNLENWKLSDRAGRELKLSGELAAGETVRIMLERKNDNSMMLKNGDGWILLYQGAVRRAAVKYAKPQSEQVIEFEQD